jgi:sugar/nucleoside kinase (ribokinase family)
MTDTKRIYETRSKLESGWPYNGSLYNGVMAELPIVDVVGVGLNATDTLIPLVRYPERGSKTEYSGSTVMPGGQVATTMVACQTWGLRTRYVGKLGDDDAARLHKEAFEHAGVEARLVTVPGGTSPQSLIWWMRAESGRCFAGAMSGCCCSRRN